MKEQGLTLIELTIVVAGETVIWAITAVSEWACTFSGPVRLPPSGC